jgi:4-amino-4-deoxy-L-arabinose transferase-like glycosyltransferase
VTDRRVVWIVLLAATAVRLAVAARIPLVEDEAYYWAWSQRLAWGYPDHPPAIAGLIRLTTSVLGDGPLGVRAGPILLNLGIAWLLYDLGRTMFSTEVGALAALWFQTIPLFSLGGMLSFPDAPFMFAWMLSMSALWRARAGRGFIWWPVAGIAIGLAALSKLAAVFLGIGAAGYVLWGERDRAWWRRAGPYLAAALAVALALPVIRWNAVHGGIMLEKARDPYEWVSTGIPALNALAYAGAQFLYYGALSAALLIAALLILWRGRRALDRRSVYMLWMGIPLLGGFAAMSFDGIAKPHWAAPGYLVALLPAAVWWMAVRDRRPWRAVTATAVGINTVLVGTFAVLALWPGSPIAREQRAWPEFAHQVQRLVEETPSAPGRFVLVLDYQTAALIEYHLRGRAPVVVTPFGFDAYAVWVQHEGLIGWNAIYLTAEPSLPRVPLARIAQRFQRLEVLPPIPFAAGGQTFRTYAVYRGFGYRGHPRPGAAP